MKRIRSHAQVWAAPAIGAVYFALWWVGEAGRHPLIDNLVVFGLLATAIALSVWMPHLSLVIVVAVPALQFLGLAVAPSNTTWPAYGAASIVAFFVGLNATRRVRVLALPAGAIAAMLMALCIAGPVIARTGDGVVLSMGGGTRESLVILSLAAFGTYAAGWGIGLALRASRGIKTVSVELHHTETRFEQTNLELRVTEDRARIARDVHDALAHSLAVIISQAQGALAVADAKPATARESLANIAEVGRASLLDVRSLVERIQFDDDAVEARATLDDLPGLVQRMRELGMDASLQNSGEPGRLVPTQELAVFRIVQESLTNALKHSGARSIVSVALRWEENGLALSVQSVPTQVTAAPYLSGPGVGIRGMQERARLAGGWLRTENAEVNTFTVVGFIPYRTGHPADFQPAVESAHA